ncbi:MAG: threonine synthase [Ignavibacteriaceae bacterium]
MKFYSTNNKTVSVSFKDAVLKGIADDGGLFMPYEIPKLKASFIKNLQSKSFHEIAFEAAKIFLEEDIPHGDIKNILSEAISFDAPLAQLDENKYILELFHGPTLAFKDFGARFMAKVMSYLIRNENKEITILVATSGDTGSAVAQGFYKTEGINVILLYPSEKVSLIQEKQLTTIGDNITALEVEGTFDDCQRLVKTAFLDKDITNALTLSSANSINIARLIPQSFYYLNAVAQLKDLNKPLFITVPSGNFGNLTAGLFANRMGLPVTRYIAALNSNDVFLEYINTGKYNPRPSIKTISNAMDVGNPSNFVRILDLYNNDHNKIEEKIYSAAFNDDKTKDGIKEVKANYNYIIDPHGSVGYLALKQFIEENKIKNYNGIILETAHPAKFKDEVEDVIKEEIKLPETLRQCMMKEKRSIKISKEYDDLKSFILNKGVVISK